MPLSTFNVYLRDTENNKQSEAAGGGNRRFAKKLSSRKEHCYVRNSVIYTYFKMIRFCLKL